MHTPFKASSTKFILTEVSDASAIVLILSKLHYNYINTIIFYVKWIAESTFTIGSNCARTIDVRHTLNRHTTTAQTRVAYDSSTWHAINARYIHSTRSKIIIIILTVIINRPKLSDFFFIRKKRSAWYDIRGWLGVKTKANYLWSIIINIKQIL